ncbi:MAG: polymer-forming cytoskeletal protein [Anaerolineales bacterium]
MMNKRSTIVWVCLTVRFVSLVFTGSAHASNGYTPLMDDEVVFFGTYTLESGNTLDGNLVVFGGVVSLEVDSAVRGDVVIFGGNVTVDGEITKNLVAIGGVASLSATAVVHGDLIAPATVIQRDEGAVIFGQIITENIPEIDIPEITVPDTPDVPDTPQAPFYSNVSNALRPVVQFFAALARALVFSAVSVLTFLIVPKNGSRVSKAIESNPVATGGFGLLSVAVFTAAVVMLGLLSITVILIPLTVPAIILLSLALALGLLFGLIAAGAETGRRIMNAFKQTWSVTLQVALGSFSLAFVLGLLSLGLWSFLGGLLWMAVGAMGLGSVLITRFGTRPYVPPSSSAKSEPESLLPDEAEIPKKDEVAIDESPEEEMEE